MKKLATLCLVAICLLAIELTVAGCGIPPPTTQVNTTVSGNWEAQLSEGSGQGTLVNFVTTFRFSNLGALDITYLNFLNSNTCFQSGQTASGDVVNASTLTNGQFNGTLKYKIVSGFPKGNTLALQGNITGTSSGTSGTIGTLTDGAVTGTWTLTGSSDCGGSKGMSGTFTMCQGSATCTPIL